MTMNSAFWTDLAGSQSSIPTDFNFAGGPGLGLPGGGGLQYGIDRSVPKILVENTYEFRDTVSKQIGNKFLKFGTQIIRDRTTVSGGKLRARNTPSTTSCLWGTTLLSSRTPLTSISHRRHANSRFYFRDTSFNFFVQTTGSSEESHRSTWVCGTSTHADQ